jgi:hypothetical protein
MDFIEELPLSGTFNSVLVVTDRFTKRVRFIPTRTDILAMELAEIFLTHIFTQTGYTPHQTSSLLESSSPRHSRRFSRSNTRSSSTPLSQVRGFFENCQHAFIFGYTPLKGSNDFSLEQNRYLRNQTEPMKRKVSYKMRMNGNMQSLKNCMITWIFLGGTTIRTCLHTENTTIQLN